LNPSTPPPPSKSEAMPTWSMPISFEVRLGVQRRGQAGRRREGERRALHKGCSSSADVTMCAMIRFARPRPSVLAFLFPAVSLAAQTDVTGEWEASYATPLGPQELKIYLTQEGPRISGHTTSEYGESQVRGTIDGQGIAFTFDATDGR
jgi:hypothetical protein